MKNKLDLKLILEKIIKKEINLIEGARIVNSYHEQVDIADQTLFYYFKAIDSETDHLPLEKNLREVWNKEALEKYDIEINEYIGLEYESTCKACRELLVAIPVKKLSNPEIFNLSFPDTEVFTFEYMNSFKNLYISGDSSFVDLSGTEYHGFIINLEFEKFSIREYKDEEWSEIETVVTLKDLSEFVIRKHEITISGMSKESELWTEFTFINYVISVEVLI